MRKAENGHMPRQILFIQGAGEGVHDAWDDSIEYLLAATILAGVIPIVPG